MNRLVVSALGALSLLACQAPASAQTVKVTASGTVSFGLDTTGDVFGPQGSVLTGDAFSYTATYNIAQAGYFTNGQRSDIYGGQAYSYLPYDPPSLGGGVLTINGESQTVHGQWNSWIFAASSASFSDDFQLVQDYVNTPEFSENNEVQMVEIPGFGLFSYPDLMLPSGNLCDIADCTSSSFAFNESIDGALVSQAFGNLAPSQIVITVSPAPEPASWALLIAGFASLGAVLRWSRGRAAAA
jgi:hypothetical protein